MKHCFTEQATAGKLVLYKNAPEWGRPNPVEAGDDNMTLAWNTGPDQVVTIDKMPMRFPAQSILPMISGQGFHFSNPETITGWQFNRDFYCIAKHDAEVGCSGFLVYGHSEPMFITLKEAEQASMRLLVEVFLEEMDEINRDNIQAEMLRVLLKRLIIKVTRIAKEQFTSKLLSDDKFNTIRKFNLLVEFNFKQQHEVQFYAMQLNKSPKTLSNLFALYNHYSPLKTIQNRLIQEVKRQFYYTEKSAKEVAAEVGFHDTAHFSRFFKNQTGITISEFRQLLKRGSAE